MIACSLVHCWTLQNGTADIAPGHRGNMANGAILLLVVDLAAL